jgi:type III secretion system YscQ/HrcQ family protein
MAAGRADGDGTSGPGEKEPNLNPSGEDSAGSTAESAHWRASRARLFSALPRYSGTALALRNRAFLSAPMIVAGDRLLLWCDHGPVRTIGELACRLGDWPLALAADNLAAVVSRIEGFESFVPTDTCAALVENALSPILSLIERLAGLPVDCEEFRRRPAAVQMSDEVQIGFRVVETERLQPLLRGWVRASPDVWRQLDFARAPTLHTQRTDPVPVRLTVEVGRLRLPLRELRGLQVGDALRPQSRILRSDHLSVRIADAGNHFVLRARVQGEDLFMEHAVNTPSAVDAPPDERVAQPGALDDVECDLTFELGSLRMTVGDIGRLRAGHAMRLGVRLQEQPVRVLVNGKLLARGELAAVGDELVVVLTDTARLPGV